MSRWDLRLHPIDGNCLCIGSCCRYPFCHRPFSYRSTPVVATPLPPTISPVMRSRLEAEILEGIARVSRSTSTSKVRNTLHSFWYQTRTGCIYSADLDATWTLQVHFVLTEAHRISSPAETQIMNLLYPFVAHQFPTFASH